jgi:type IV pilus assembly protein PilB
MAPKLGEMLISHQIITDEQLRQALTLQKREGGRLGTSLVKLGYVSEDKLVAFLSKQFGVPAINLADYPIDASVVKLIPVEIARKYVISESGIVTSIANYYGGKGEVVTREVVQETPSADTSKILEAKDYTLDGMEADGGDFGGLDDGPMVDVEDFDSVVGSALDGVDMVEEQDDSEAVVEVEAPIVKLVNGILVNAVKTKASDIHIEPYEAALRVRFRVDGVMYTVMNLPTKIRAALTSRLKIMSKLDIAERRLPQDGRIKLKLGRKREIDFRVSTLPTIFGEKTVLRLLDKANLNVDLTKLGFEEAAMDDFMGVLDKPYGMILVTGPTGSGKTTTLYSALTHLNKPGINIMTAEDPVEYNFMGINQVHVREDIGLTFASSLRSFLRQDPDIIMVGEIRDFETAEIAVKAALTGHLVLSTLHTNDAPSTINRLLNMGIEPFLVSSSVIIILAQRLARKICLKCKEEENVPPQGLVKVGFSEQEAESVKAFKGTGCAQCNSSGYRGRVALYEVMTLGDELKELVLEGASTEEIKRCAIRNGMKTLRMSGLTKVKEGVTSIEEVLRVSFGD